MAVLDLHTALSSHSTDSVGARITSSLLLTPYTLNPKPPKPYTYKVRSVELRGAPWDGIHGFRMFGPAIRTPAKGLNSPYYYITIIRIVTMITHYNNNMIITATITTVIIIILLLFVIGILLLLMSLLLLFVFRNARMSNNNEALTANAPQPQVRQFATRNPCS